MSTLSLRKNFYWSLAGNVVYAGCQWGVLVVLAKLGTPEMVGKFALGLAITAPIFMLTNLQLRSVQATDARGDYLFADYLGLRIVTSSLALILISGITLAGSYHWDTAIVILAVGVAKAFESVSDVFFGLFQQRGRMDRIGVSMMIKGALSLLVVGTAVWFTGTVVWGALGLGIVWGVLLLNYDMRNGLLILVKQLTTKPIVPVVKRMGLHLLKPTLNSGVLRSLVCLTLPLGFSMMLISLNTNIPRYFIMNYLGERELGIFAAMGYLMVCGGTVLVALGQAASPKLAKHYISGDRRAFRLLIYKLVGIATFLGFCGLMASILAGREILMLLYGYEYAKNSCVFILLMVGAGFSYMASCLNYAMIALRQFRSMLVLTIIVLSAVTIMSLWLVPLEGLGGAARALLIGYMIHALVGGIIVRSATMNKGAFAGE